MEQEEGILENTEKAELLRRGLLQGVADVELIKEMFHMLARVSGELA